MVYDPADPIWRSDVMQFVCFATSLTLETVLADLEANPEFADQVREGLIRYEEWLVTRMPSTPES